MIFGAANPVVVVPAARTASAWGCRHQPGAVDPRCPPNSRIHAGTDIAAPVGSRVNAPVDAQVIAVWPNFALSRYGVLLALYVPEDHVTLVFAHLEQLPARESGEPLRVGDWVRMGEQVARVGYTGGCRTAVGPHGTACTPCGPGGAYLCGGASGSHLHFEQRPGRVTRPNPYGPSRDPRFYARQRGFLLHSGAGGGVAGLGAIDCTNVNAYCDPNGFEPGDDEPMPSSRGGWLAAGFAALALAGAAFGAAHRG